MKKVIGTFKSTQFQKAVIAVAILALVGIFVYNKVKPDLHFIFNKEDVVVTETIVDEGEKIIEINDSDKIDVDKIFPMDISEVGMQNFIHQMSHQKVRADEKWGMIPLTKERVARLIEIVEENKANYNHANTYLGILNRWYKNDFSRIDKEHNTIWAMQNGNVGKATGILSYDEEMKYISENYNIE